MRFLRTGSFRKSLHRRIKAGGICVLLLFTAPCLTTWGQVVDSIGRQPPNARRVSLQGAYYQQGNQVLEGTPLLTLYQSTYNMIYGLGNLQEYGFFVRNKLLVRAGFLYTHTFSNARPEQYHAHTWGPTVGLTYHLRNRHKPDVNFMLGADFRYLFFSYRPEGRFVYFEDVPGDDRVLHSGPMVRAFGGIIYHINKTHAVSFNFGAYKQLHQTYPISPLTRSYGGMFVGTGMKADYRFTYRYTFRK